MRLRELDIARRAALLRLDPIRDRDEYAELAVLLPRTCDRRSSADLAPTASAAALARRARNLGVDAWGVWARGDAGSTLDALEDPDVRCLVVDLGSLATQDERALVAQAVLERLWSAARPPPAGADRDRRGPQRVPRAAARTR